LLCSQLIISCNKGKLHLDKTDGLSNISPERVEQYDKETHLLKNNTQMGNKPPSQKQAKMNDTYATK
jgi:hypothetical protein